MLQLFVFIRIIDADRGLVMILVLCVCAVKLMPHSNAVTKGNAKLLAFRPTDVFLFIKSTVSGLEIMNHLFRQGAVPRMRSSSAHFTPYRYRACVAVPHISLHTGTAHA